jgi:hypothetical protein
MEGKAKRVSTKTKTEAAFDSFLWRLANRQHSVSIAISYLSVSFALGALVSWVIL